jgi:hypothetical protein
MLGAAWRGGSASSPSPSGGSRTRSWPRRKPRPSRPRTPTRPPRGPQRGSTGVTWWSSRTWWSGSVSAGRTAGSRCGRARRSRQGLHRVAIIARAGRGQEAPAHASLPPPADVRLQQGEKRGRRGGLAGWPGPPGGEVDRLARQGRVPRPRYRRVAGGHRRRSRGRGGCEWRARCTRGLTGSPQAPSQPKRRRGRQGHHYGGPRPAGPGGTPHAPLPHVRARRRLPLASKRAGLHFPALRGPREAGAAAVGPRLRPSRPRIPTRPPRGRQGESRGATCSSSRD